MLMKDGCKIAVNPNANGRDPLDFLFKIGRDRRIWTADILLPKQAV